MRDFFKRNGILVVAFALPALLLAGVAASVYFPSRNLAAKFDFVYASCGQSAGNYYQCGLWLQKRYAVTDGKIAVVPVAPASDADKNGVPDVQEDYAARLFYHDTLADESREITLADAQKLQLSGLLASPDGLTVTGQYRGGGDFFPFSSRGSSYGYYLAKGNVRRRLNINNADPYAYDGNFRFLGWVLPGRE